MDALNLFARLTLDTSAYDSGLKSAQGRASSFGSKLTKSFNLIKTGATVALTAATGAITAFATASVKAGMTFDASMSQVAATMGKTMSDLEKEVGSVDLAWGKFTGNLREYAQEMGEHTAFSATECADALNYMALAGYDAQTSMEMLPNVLNLAAAGGMDLARASDMVTDAQSALGLSIEDTTTMVDEMAKAAATTNTSVEQLGDAMLQIGGTARGMAGGTKELSAVLGVLADNGIKGAEGGTKLRNVILSLSSPTDKAAKTLDALGVSLYDDQGEMRALDQVIGELNASLDGMSSAERKDIINTIFNKQDLKAVEALLGTTADRWEEVYSAINDAAGAAQDMAETQLDNLQGDVTLFKSALEGTQIAISDNLTPALREFVQFGSDGLTRLTKAIKEDGLTGAMETLGTVISDGLDLIVSKLPEFVDAGAKLLSSLVTGITNNAKKIASAGVEIAKTLATAITSNLPIVIQGAADLVVSFAEGLLDSVDEIVPAVVSMFERILEILITQLPKLITVAAQIVSKLAQYISKNANKIVPGIVKLVKEVGSAIIKNIPVILKAAAQVAKSFVSELSKTLASEIPSMSGVFTGIGKALSGAFGWIEKNGDKIASILVKVGVAVAGIKFVNFIGQGFSNFMSIFGNIGKAGGGVINVLSTLNTKLKGAESALGGFLSNIGSGKGLEMLKTGFTNLGTKINSFSDNLSGTAKGLLAIGGATASIMGVSDAFTKLADNTEDVNGAILEMGASVGTSAAAFIAAFGVPGGLIAAALGALVGLIKGVYEHIEKINMKKAEDAIISLQGNIEGATHSFQDYADAFSTLTSGIISSFETMRGKFEDLGAAKGTIGEVVDKIGSIGSAMQASAELSQGQISDLMSAYDQLNSKLAEYISSYYDYSIQQMMIDKNYELSRKDLTDAERKEIEDFYNEKISLLYQERDAEIKTAADATKAAQERTSALSEAKAKEEELAQAYADGKLSGTAYHEQQKAAHKEVNELTKEQGEIINQVTDLTGKYISTEEGMGAAIDDSATKLQDFQEKLSGSLKLTNSEVQNGFEGTKTSVVEAVNSISAEYARLKDEAEADLKRSKEINGEQSEEYKRHAATVEEQMSGYTATYKEYMQSILDDAKEFGTSIPQMLIDQGMSPQAAYDKAREFSKVFGVDGLGGAIDQAISETGVEIENYGKTEFERAIKGMFEFSNVAGFGSLPIVMATGLKTTIQTGIDQGFAGVDQYASGKMQEVFAGVPEGGAKGITDNLDSITSAVFSMGDAAENAGLERLDINSPSHVFQEQGASIVEGMNKGIEDNMDSTTSVMDAWIDSIAGSVDDSLSKLENGFKDLGKKISDYLKKGFTGVSDNLRDEFVKPINKGLKKIQNTFTKFSTAGKTIGENLKKGIANKANDVINAMKAIATKVLNVWDQYKAKWQGVGKNIVAGIQKGIEQGRSGLVQTMVDVALAAYNAAKQALEIASPSKKTKRLGAWLAEGLAEGVAQNEDKAVKAMEEMSAAILSEAEKRLENYKKVNAVSLKEEITYWNEVIKQVEKGTQAYLDAVYAKNQLKTEKEVNSLETLHHGKWDDLSVHGIQDSIVQGALMLDYNMKKRGVKKGERDEAIVDAATQAWENYKATHETTLEDEYNFYQKLANITHEGTQEWYNAQKNAIDARNAYFEEQAHKALTLESLDLNMGFDDFLADTVSDFGDWASKMQEYAGSAEEYGQDVLSEAQTRLDNWTSINDMTKEEELAFWEEVLRMVPEGTQAYINATKKVTDAKAAVVTETEALAKRSQEFYDKSESMYGEFTSKMQSLSEKYADDKIKLEQNLQSKIQSIHDKERDDIERLEDNYRNSVNSRKNAIMSMTGLFDRVAYDQTWSKDYLLETLQQQVDSLNDWDFELDTLEGRIGEDNPLLKAIEDMGVAGLYTLKEINGMTDDELQKYSDLYAKKAKIAGERSVQDNRELRRETDRNIAEAQEVARNSILEAEAEFAASLQKLNAEYEANSVEVFQKYVQDWEKLKADYADVYTQVNTDAKIEMEKLTGQMKSDLDTLATESNKGGKDVGEKMIEGMKNAIESGQSAITAAAQSVAQAAYAAAMAALDAHSPSRKFMYVGEMVDKGFAAGITKFASTVTDVVKDTFDVADLVPATFDFGESKVGSARMGGDFIQNLTVNSPQALDPSEVARQTRLMNQQMVLALRGAG